MANTFLFLFGLTQFRDWWKLLQLGMHRYGNSQGLKFLIQYKNANKLKLHGQCMAYYFTNIHLINIILSKHNIVR